MSYPLLATILLSSIYLAKGITGQGVINPCPDLLTYLPAESTATSWTASILLRTDEELRGVWLRLVLDSPPTDITSPFGEVVQRDANEYLIRKQNFKLSPTKPETIKVKVEFEGTPPHIVSFNLNAKQVCPNGASSSGSIPGSVVSPCPNVFMYDPPGVSNDQWTGTLTLSSDAELNGIYSRISFDKPPLEVTSDFGDAVQRETTDYLIRKPDYKLLVGRVLKIKLIVKYDPAEGAAPRLTTVRLNAKQICPAEIAPVTPPPIAKGLISPCPKIFNYLSLDKDGDKWYGQVVFNVKYALIEPTITILLDRPSLQLRGWTGHLKTQDNVEYVLSKPGLVLNPGPFTFKFSIKYKNTRPMPKLSEIQINKQSVCPVDSGNLLNPAPPGSFSAMVTPQPVIPRSPVSAVNSRGSVAYHDPFTDSLNRFLNPGVSLGLNGDNNCGTTAVTAEPLITNGQATQPGMHPWHVAVYNKMAAELSYICGATLVTKSYVATAAHCATRQGTIQPVKPTVLLVTLGKFYLERLATTGVQERNVAKVLVHPQYNHTVFSHDLALLKMDTKADYTDTVRPICLWNGPKILNSVVGEEGVVVGWGWNENGRFSEQLVKTVMPIVDPATCIRSNPGFYGKFTNEFNFCAGFRNGSSACNGDSGGGLALSRAEGGRVVWYLRGIVSTSIPSQTLKCDTSNYIIFTDVAQHIDWITSTMKNN